MPENTWTLQPYPTPEATAALIIPVPVAGGPGLEPLKADDPDEAIHERIGGYWDVGIGPDQRLGKIQAALKAGRRVLIVGFREAKVIRILEVGTTSPYPPPKTYMHENTLCNCMLKQPDTAFLGSRKSLPFAVTYARRNNGVQEFRARYFTQPTFDNAWVGRRLEAAVGQMSYQSPGLYSSADVPAATTR